MAASTPTKPPLRITQRRALVAAAGRSRSIAAAASWWPVQERLSE